MGILRLTNPNKPRRGGGGEKSGNFTFEGIEFDRSGNIVRAITPEGQALAERARDVVARGGGNISGFSALGTAKSQARFDAQSLANQRVARRRAEEAARKRAREARKIKRSERPPLTVTIAPKLSKFENLGRRRAMLRQKKQRGQKLTLKEEAELAGKTLIESVVAPIATLPELRKLAKEIRKDPKKLIQIGKNIPKAISEGGKEFGELLRTSPTEAFVKIGAEIFLLKGTGKVFKVAGKVGGRSSVVAKNIFKGTKVTKTKIFTKVKTVTKGGKKTTAKIELKVGGPVKRIQEPLSKQVGLAGERVTGVSAQADRLVNIIRKQRIIRKPIPGEDKLSSVTKRLLKRFDEGKITKKQLITLDRAIRKETKGAGNLLERSFFADPRGRFRPSRLGVKQKEASLLDLLGGDITFKTPKPQILIFANAKVQKFPKALLKIQKKLKAGKSLTKKEAEQLLKFQLKKSGKFKPIGALSKEPEITLAPGEIIKKVRTTGSAIINGKKVNIVQVKVIKATPKTKKLIKKSKAGKITAKEIKELKKRLKKETGFKSRLSRGKKGARPRARVPKRIKVPKRTKRTPKRTKRITRRTPRPRPSPRPPKRPPIRPPTRGRPGPRPTPRPPARPPRRPPARPPARPPKTPPRLKPKRKKKKKVIKKKKVRAFNVFAKPIKGKRLVKVNVRPLTKAKAQDLRNYILDTSLSRTGKIKGVKGKPKQPKIKVPAGFNKRTMNKFRRHRIVKGRKVAIRKGKVIEKKTRLLDTRQERKKITLRKRIRQLQGIKKKKVVKRKVKKRVVRRKVKKRKR